jgi:predicted DCC family thiol-disulfide oxidoreductase YuxK
MPVRSLTPSDSRWRRHQPQPAAESAIEATNQPSPALTLLYDGACPLCLKEVEALRSRDGGRGLICFVDIDAAGYDPTAHAGISYRQAMGRIHAIAADGRVIQDVAVFREAYRLVGLGWLYAPTAWPLLGPGVDGLYRLWAGWRLRLTGRPDLETLCAGKEGACRSVHPPCP